MGYYQKADAKRRLTDLETCPNIFFERELKKLYCCGFFLFVRMRKEKERIPHVRIYGEEGGSALCTG